MSPPVQSCSILVVGRCECICMHSEAKTFAQRPTVKEPLLSKKNNKGRLKFCRKFNDWTAGVWCKANFSNKALFRLFRTSGNLIVQRRKGECYQESCVMPRLKNPSLQCRVDAEAALEVALIYRLHLQLHKSSYKVF